MLLTSKPTTRWLNFNQCTGHVLFLLNLRYLFIWAITWAFLGPNRSMLAVSTRAVTIAVAAFRLCLEEWVVSEAASYAVFLLFFYHWYRLIAEFMFSVIRFRNLKLWWERLEVLGWLWIVHFLGQCINNVFHRGQWWLWVISWTVWVLWWDWAADLSDSEAES